MKAISLFSGAMGLDLGMTKAGFDVKVCNEIDPVMVETIKLNTKIPVIGKDINDVPSEELLTVGGLKKGEVDLIFGGPPCQAFSTAGARRALGDVRGNVILSFLRIVRDIRPKTFLLENVRGLLYAKIDFVPEGFDEAKYKHVLGKKGGLIYFIFKEFEKLGYKVSFALFDSANYGVPQKRERILMFGSLSPKEVELPKPTHFKDGFGGKKWTPIKEVFKGLEDEKMDYVEFRDKHKVYLEKLIAGQYWKHLTPEDQKAALGKSYELQGGKTGFFRRLAWDEPAPTLVTSPIMPATMLCHPDKLRPLSVQEYARIQQFPDNWKFSGKLALKYKQIGNAVPVGLGYVAGTTLMNHLQGLHEEENQVGYRFSRYGETDHKTFITKLDFIPQASFALN